MAKQKKHPTGTIAQNKKARHDYFIEHKFEAGLVLAGWEVKSLRASKLQLVDSYVLLKDGEAWLLGSHITPLMTASTHVIADPVRTRKLLLNRRELDKLAAAVQQKGYACVCLSWYWSKHMVKCEIALGKGKKLFADGSAPHSYKLTGSRVSSTGGMIAHQPRDGGIKTSDAALASPSDAERARQARMKRER